MKQLHALLAALTCAALALPVHAQLDAGTYEDHPLPDGRTFQSDRERSDLGRLQAQTLALAIEWPKRVVFLDGGAGADTLHPAEASEVFALPEGARHHDIVHRCRDGRRLRAREGWRGVPSADQGVDVWVHRVPHHGRAQGEAVFISQLAGERVRSIGAQLCATGSCPPVDAHRLLAALCDGD